MKVLFPRSVDEALAMLAGPEAPTPFAGGTDLLVHWPVNLKGRDRTYMDLSGLERELRPMAWESGVLRMGALTTYWDVVQDARCREEFPLLVAAAKQVGAIQIQSRGTWAGNIVNASPAADGVPVLMACDAMVVMRSERGGEIRVPLDRFYSGYKQMARQPDQLVVAIEVSRRKWKFSEFHKVGPRRAQAITKVGVAITNSAGGWRIVANSVAPTVRRCRAVEQILDSEMPFFTSPEHFRAALSSDTKPIDDIRSTAEYRRAVLARVLYHSLRGVAPGVR